MCAAPDSAELPPPLRLNIRDAYPSGCAHAIGTDDVCERCVLQLVRQMCCGDCVRCIAIDSLLLDDSSTGSRRTGGLR